MEFKPMLNIEKNEFKDRNLIKYLELLSQKYPNIGSAATEIINLEAILNLPKGTEHFLSDIHGEYEPFIHVLKNGSGVIKRKIEDIFGKSLMDSEKKSLATLVYYPEQKLELVIKEEKNISNWYRITLYRLIKLCRNVSSKYTRSKVRKALPSEFAYVIEELLHENSDEYDKKKYYDRIITTIIDIGRARDFIIALSKVIQRLVIDRLHIIGDIYDRGPRPDIILDTLMDYHSVDIQWGNHDIVWMGAAAGQKVCIANVLRISARYSNLDIIEDIYGINLIPLATFAMKNYENDSCAFFMSKSNDANLNSKHENELIAKMHKAITIIQFKLEYEVIKRRPEFQMEHRLLLNKIDYDKGVIVLDGIEYELTDKNFPTIKKEHPFKLTEEEEIIIEKLKSSFVNSNKLQSHILFLLSKGSIYLNYNSNLLFHGCIPLNEDKSFKTMNINGKEYSGRELLDKFEILVREGYFNKEDIEKKEYGMDIMWYLWNGSNSSLFGKENMATFERYFIKDKSMHVEKMNPYYDFRDDEEVCNMILNEFGICSKDSIIINGHVPVKNIKGESPVKANGKLIVIDGGFAKAYRGYTGIAGYTLIYNSYGLQLVEHEPFDSIENAILYERDILSTTLLVKKRLQRKRVGDTDIGIGLKNQITDLKLLLLAYRSGIINEKTTI